jgi:hypothetical protein
MIVLEIKESMINKKAGYTQTWQIKQAGRIVLFLCFFKLADKNTFTG